MPAKKSIAILGGLIALALTAACVAEQPEPSPEPTATATATVSPAVPTQPLPTATPIPTMPAPTPIVSILIDVNAGPLTTLVPLDELSTKEILDVVERRFEGADSYVADVKITSFLENETFFTESAIEVGPNHRAHGVSVSGGQEQELLYVQGFSYTRPAGDTKHPWTTIGRGELSSITRMREAIRGINNAEIVREWEEDGRKFIELHGDFNDGSSGPPPISFDRIRVTSSKIVLDAETLLPVSLEVENIMEIRHFETGELIEKFGWIIEAAIRNYGQVTVVAEHPKNLEPTPKIVPATATSTSTPTLTPTPSPTPVRPTA